ncbi:hypothetical protein A9Q86_05025 [Flavobacteriales bacterium 33_180_T64]|nr:hypothetical protein A9Q86_05025 [Flavobacteriales bacterium 33_180_T64]
MKVLTIISHTEHYKTANGTILGLGSTVTEINNLLSVFDEIHHVAMLHSNPPPPSALPYSSNKIVFIPIQAVGGSRLKDKISILWNAPRVINTVRKALKQSDCFQFRAPTGIGVFVIPYLVFFSSKKGWFKYAGNWNQKAAPMAYRFQKWMLKNQNRYVTINGQWSNQPKQCLTFENPCLTMQELEKGNMFAMQKSIAESLIDFCFVGRLEKEKGISILIEAFHNLSDDDKGKVRSIHIVGDGKDRLDYQELAKKTNLNFVFHGFLSRSDVHEIYINSHAIVLPSASEGFPKVIAEALNYGCIPVVSNVSGISHYVKDNENGFLLDAISAKSVQTKLQNVLRLSSQDYSKMIASRRENIEKFTYKYYNNRISNELIK